MLDNNNDDNNNININNNKIIYYLVSGKNIILHDTGYKNTDIRLKRTIDREE